MKLLDVTEVKLEWLDLSTLTQHKPRPYEIIPGKIGTTQILRYIATTLGTLKLHEEDVEDIPWRILMGMGWETMCAQMYEEMHWPARVLHHGGIMGHPDANSWVSGRYGDAVLDDAFCIDEFKYTAKSVREKGAPAHKLKDIRAEWMWQRQVMSYHALMLKTNAHVYGANIKKRRFLGRFHIMWAMGAYEKWTLDERYLRYLVEYEQEEIEKHWAMMEANEEGARKWIQGRP